LFIVNQNIQYSISNFQKKEQYSINKTDSRLFEYFNIEYFLEMGLCVLEII